MIPYNRQTIDEDDIASVVRVLRSDYLTTGEEVARFEAALAQTCGARFAVAVSSGTAALHLAALALLRKGAKVLTTPNSFVATANAILYAQAVPVFVDIDASGNIDLDACYVLLQKDPSIKALVVVHFAGRPLDAIKLARIQKTFNPVIIEDGAHALGALGVGACEHSHATTFSFHPVKSVTTGEGGAITTNDAALYERLLRLRNHGIVRSPKIGFYEIEELGFNYRLSDIQCALGRSQLDKLPDFLFRRHALAKRYEALLAPLKGVKPLHAYDAKSAYHLYVVRIDFSALGMTKERLFDAMKTRGVMLQQHYIPIYAHALYGETGGDFPQTEAYFSQSISLPLFPLLTFQEQDRVIEALKEVLYGAK